MWLVFGLVVLASSLPLYGKVPHLILKKTNRLTQAVVFSRRHIFCEARCCGIGHQQTVKVYLCTTRMFNRTLYAQHPVSQRVFLSLPGSHLRLFIAREIQHTTLHSFLKTPAQIDAPCRLEAYYARKKKRDSRLVCLYGRTYSKRMDQPGKVEPRLPILLVVS